MKICCKRKHIKYEEMKKSIFTMLMTVVLIVSASCGSKEKSQKEANETDTAAFALSQPVENGIYDATAYAITGENAAEGKFDGRVIVSLSPERSALYVYENGNRVKIKNIIILDKPFEKGDSNVYRAVDNKGKQVTVSLDSAANTLTFDREAGQYKIEFSKEARSKGTAIEMYERINEQVNR